MDEISDGAVSHDATNDDEPVAQFHPTIDVESHSWLGDIDRFGRLHEAGFRDHPTVNAAMARVEQLLNPPEMVEQVLQAEAMKYAADVKPEVAGQFANLFYSAMRNGWSAAEAVMHARGVELPHPANDVFDDRLAALTRDWYETDPWADLSDLAFYLLDDLMPSVRHHAEELLKAVVPNVELPGNWELLPPLRMPLERATSGVLFATATVMAAAGVQHI